MGNRQVPDSPGGSNKSAFGGASSGIERKFRPHQQSARLFQYERIPRRWRVEEQRGRWRTAEVGDAMNKEKHMTSTKSKLIANYLPDTLLIVTLRLARPCTFAGTAEG